MTRKHFKLIAATLKTRRELILHDSSIPVEQRAVAVRAIDMLASDFGINLAVESERFDRAKFLTACK